MAVSICARSDGTRDAPVHRMEDIMTTNELVEELNELIQLDYDASKTYEQALEHIRDGDGEVRADLEAFRGDHLRHIEELRAQIERQGGAAIEPGRDVKGLLLEGMTRLRSVTGTLGALKAMRMNEKLTNRSYERASDLGLPPGVRDIVLANLADERRHLAAIEGHITRLRERADTDDKDDDKDDDDEDTRDVVPPMEGLPPAVGR